MRSDRKSLRFFLPIPSFFSTFTVQKASFKPKPKRSFNEKCKAYDREREGVQAGADGALIDEV
jgi:hypothetical protein